MRLLKSLSARHLFVTFIAIVAVLFAVIGGFAINHQSKTTISALQTEASKVEQETAKRYLNQYLLDRQVAFKQMSTSPILVSAAMGNSVNNLEIRDHINQDRIFKESVSVALFDIANDVVFSEINLTGNKLLAATSVERIFSHNGSSIVSLIKKGRKLYFWMFLPITYNNSVEGVLQVEFLFKDKEFFSALTNDGQRWVALRQFETGVVPEAPEGVNWRIAEVPINDSGLTLLYAVNTASEDKQRSTLLYRLATTTFITLSVCLIGSYFLGSKIMVQPFEELAKSRKKLAESSELLKRQEAESRRLAKVARHAKDVIIITDTHGLVTWVNQAFTQLTEYEPKEIIGRKPGSILQGPDTNHETKHRLRKAIIEKRHVREEILNYSKSGKSYWIDIDITPVHDEQGRLEGFIAVERDISEKQKMQASLKEALTKAESANTAKSHFLASISHEIRTPMNGILGIAQLMQKTELSTMQREYIDTLCHSGSHMMTLLNDLLDFSKIEAGKLVLSPGNFQLLPLIQEIESTYSPLCTDKGIEFECVHSIDESVWLFGDKERVRQVIANLVSNATKFTEEGQIKVGFEVQSSEQHHLIVRVEDTGIGISSDRQQSIFDPFIQAESSTTRNYGGTGLGLAIAKQICEAMDGQIALTSKSGLGSIFTASFGLRAGRSEHELTEKPTQSYQGMGRKVLIVEDNRVNIMIIEKFMKARGFECDIAMNGQIAVDMADKNFYPIILMDNHMPEMDGIQATQVIRAQEVSGQSSIIIGCTADAYATTRDAMMNAGCDEVLVKPLKEAHLDDMLHRLHDQLVA